MSPELDAPLPELKEYITQERFHRRFILPETASHEALEFSYSDVGCLPESVADANQSPVILFMPGMFGTRYLGILMHSMAQKLGVRVLIVDRPGMGHSTDVPLEQRIKIWIELVPLFLNHLHIKYVSLLSHSAGTMYLLNTLYHCRDVLDPQKPVIALMAPFVDIAQSHVLSLQMAQFLPKQAFGLWHQIPRFFVANLMPSMAFAGASVGIASNFIASSAGGTSSSSSQPQQDSNLQRLERDYGVNPKFQTELTALALKLMFDENTVGANSEALLCAKKGLDGLWGACDDYQSYVTNLGNLESDRIKNLGEGGEFQKLKVNIFFAETDSMIGDKGRAYMDRCWTETNARFQDSVNVVTRIVEGTDHNSVVNSVDVLESVLLEAGGRKAEVGCLACA